MKFRHCLLGLLFVVMLSTTVLAQSEFNIQVGDTLELLSQDAGAMLEISLLHLSEPCVARTCEAKFSVNGQQTDSLGVGESTTISGEELTVTNLGGDAASFSLSGSYGLGQGSDNIDFTFTIGETLTYQRASDQKTLELTLLQVEGDKALFSANGERTPLLRPDSVYTTEDGHRFKLLSAHPRETKIELEGMYALVPSKSYRHGLHLSQTKTIMIDDSAYEITLLTISDCEEKEGVELVDPATGFPVPAMPPGEERSDLIEKKTMYYDCANAQAKFNVNGEQITLDVGDSRILSGVEFRLVHIDGGATTASQGVTIDLLPYRTNPDSVPAGDSESDTVIENEQEPVVDTTPSCDGCQHEGTCIPYGVRKGSAFCGLDGLMSSQKNEGQECENNYECSANLCIDNNCVAQGLFKKIINWFARLF